MYMERLSVVRTGRVSELKPWLYKPTFSVVEMLGDEK
jgi:hypothetical protein